MSINMSYFDNAPVKQNQNAEDLIFPHSDHFLHIYGHESCMKVGLVCLADFSLFGLVRMGGDRRLKIPYHLCCQPRYTHRTSMGRSIDSTILSVPLFFLSHSSPSKVSRLPLSSNLAPFAVERSTDTPG